MAIVQTVNFSSFCDAFARMGRTDQFSYEAKIALFDYLENLASGNDENYELDIVGLCCEYSEESAGEVNENYSLLIEKEEDESEEDFTERLNEEVQEFLKDSTQVVMAKDGKFVYANF